MRAPFLAEFPIAAFFIGLVVFFVMASIVSRLFRSRAGAMPPRPLGYKPVLSEPVRNLARDLSQLIAAIKLHRKQTGLGLAQAKAEVESWIADQPK